MKTKGKIAIVCVILVLSIAAPAFSQQGLDITKLKETMDDFTNNLAKSLPFNSSMGLNWADAYIGKFPRFGVGFSVGLTTMDMDSLKKLFSDFSAPAFPEWVLGSSDYAGFGGFPIPGYAVEGRIGGFGIPFDIGIKFGYMPIKEIKNSDLKKFDYFLIGGDFRYAIIEQNIILPAVSVGVGFNFLSGALGMNAGQDRTFSFTPPGGSLISATMKAPEITVGWETASLDFKAQISKNFFFITPYLGVGASTGWSTAKVAVDMKVDTSSNLEDAKKIFKAIGIDLNKKGFESESDPVNGWSFRMFGGLTFNAAALRIDLTGFYNFEDKYGATIGTRIQL